MDSYRETLSPAILSGGSTAPLWELWKSAGCFFVTVITMSLNPQKTTYLKNYSSKFHSSFMQKKNSYVII